jgi:hypothetical protein
MERLRGRLCVIPPLSSGRRRAFHFARKKKFSMGASYLSCEMRCSLPSRSRRRRRAAPSRVSTASWRQRKQTLRLTHTHCTLIRH